MTQTIESVTYVLENFNEFDILNIWRGELPGMGVIFEQGLHLAQELSVVDIFIAISEGLKG